MVNVTINDPNNDLMDWTIDMNTSDNNSGTGASNGAISCSISTPLEYFTTYTWWVNVTDGVNSTNATYTFTTEAEPAIWWDTEWSYRKEITINHTEVDEDLTNFPVLISYASDSDLVSHAQSNGDDIAFTDYYGNQLNHEIEHYNSSTGKLVAWVNVTSLSSTMNTILYMYYGNPSRASMENVAGCWHMG